MIEQHGATLDAILLHVVGRKSAQGEEVLERASLSLTLAKSQLALVHIF